MPRFCRADISHHDRVAAPRLGHEALLGELRAGPGLGVGVVAVDLVDRHHDRHLGRPGVVDGLDRLGHDAVVGRHDQHHDVGDVGAAGPHLGEGLVARGVDEGDRLAVLLDLVGADVLGDATGLAGDDVGRADAVEQQRLAVVDVAHDGDDRRARACGSGSSSSSSLNRAWSSSSCCWPGSTSRTSAPSSSREQLDLLVGEGMVAVTISPCCSRKRTTSAAVRFSLGPKSWAWRPAR